MNAPTEVMEQAHKLLLLMGFARHCR
jgi:hypothetical protein